jgi:hypothetical protein
MGKEQKNLVHEQALFAQRIETELSSSAAWKQNWNFMFADPQKREILPPAEEERRLKETLLKLRLARTKSQPVTTYQELGFRQPIDTSFSSAQFGIKRNKELMGVIKAR